MCEPMAIATYHEQFPELWENHDLVVQYLIAQVGRSDSIEFGDRTSFALSDNLASDVANEANSSHPHRHQPKATFCACLFPVTTPAPNAPSKVYTNC